MTKERSTKATKTVKPQIKDLTPRKTSQTKGGSISSALKGIGDGLQQVARKP